MAVNLLLPPSVVVVLIGENCHIPWFGVEADARGSGRASGSPSLTPSKHATASVIFLFGTYIRE